MRFLKKAYALVALAFAMVTMSGTAHAASAFIFGWTPSGEQNLILNNEIVIHASKMGWVSDSGQAELNKNYFVGGCSSGCGASGYKLKDYFTFDLSNVKVPIVSAALSVGSSSESIQIIDAVDIFWNLHDITGSLSKLGVARSAGDEEGQGLYKGISDGAAFGSWKVDPSTAGSQVQVALNDAAVKRINALAGHEFGVGGSLRWKDIVAPVAEPSTWLLMILGFGVIGYTMRRRATRVMTSQIA